jgi:protein-S-isoprenylcysteine O-methyltransferase Ste14
VDGTKPRLTSLSLIFLAVVFTVALTFATLEAPRVLNRFFVNYLDYPDYNPAIEPQAIEEFMTRYYIREIGYASLAILLVLIVAGFWSGKTSLSALGSLAFFLPTFGHFAASMFFLTGIGLVRLLWAPIWTWWTDLLRLGDVAYWPYMMVVYPAARMGTDLRRPVASLAIGLGLLIFFLGTTAWTYAKFQRKGTVDFWLYRYCRHPQYLGFIMWSYGLMLLASQAPVPLGGQNPGASFPWAISSLLVIGVAWAEEAQMTRRFGQQYEQYRRRTPFLFPLPQFASWAITAPIRILLKRERPETGTEILLTLLVYGGIVVLLSLPFVLFQYPPGIGWSDWPRNVLTAPAPPPVRAPPPP